MSDNPYQSPGDDDPPADGPIIGLRWYHLPFIFAVVCGVALVILYNIVPLPVGKFATQRQYYLMVCIAVIEAITVVDLAVCGWIICKWLRRRL